MHKILHHTLYVLTTAVGQEYVNKETDQRHRGARLTTIGRINYHAKLLTQMTSDDEHHHGWHEHGVDRFQTDHLLISQRMCVHQHDRIGP